LLFRLLVLPLEALFSGCDLDVFDDDDIAPDDALEVLVFLADDEVDPPTAAAVVALGGPIVPVGDEFELLLNRSLSLSISASRSIIKSPIPSSHSLSSSLKLSLLLLDVLLLPLLFVELGGVDCFPVLIVSVIVCCPESAFDDALIISDPAPVVPVVTTVAVLLIVGAFVANAVVDDEDFD